MSLINKILIKTGLMPKILDALVYLIRKMHSEVKADENLIIYCKGYCIGFGDDLIIKNWQDPADNSCDNISKEEQ